MSQRLKIAIQKSGRLNEKSLGLLTKSGIEIDFVKDRLINVCRNFPIEIMLVRDDDIPAYVADRVCDLGIVGENIVQESVLNNADKDSTTIQILKALNFGSCRLSLAVPEHQDFKGIGELTGRRIATSYPNCLSVFLEKNRIAASIIELNGSVEIAPSLKIADAICDLVSSGATLKSNGLKEVATLFESQAVLIRKSQALSPQLERDLERLLQRFSGVIQASESKYIMMNAPKDALPQIKRLLPGMEEPSIMPLGERGERIAIHAVARETMFWETMESLKALGASSILVLAIEKVIA